MDTDTQKIIQTICQTLYDKKGFNILTLDVRGISTMTDYYIIAEGNLERHVQALSKAIYDAVFKENRKPRHIEGKPNGEWIVMDYQDIIVHLFVPEMREKYAIEELWRESQVVHVPLKLDPEVI